MVTGAGIHEMLVKIEGPVCLGLFGRQLVFKIFEHLLYSVLSAKMAYYKAGLVPRKLPSKLPNLTN